MVTVRNKFNTLQETFESHTSNNKYENFVAGHMKTATECIPNKPKPKCRVWQKQDNLKIASSLNKRNLTNAN